jgi:putative nucleotidyltransferase with HDIG domain
MLPSVRVFDHERGGVSMEKVKAECLYQKVDAAEQHETHLRFLLEQAERNGNVLLGIIDELCTSHYAMEQMLVSTVRDIVNALDSRRWWTRQRSQRVASHCLKIAEEMGFQDDEKRTLHIGALLHDIGQSIFYDEIIDKPDRLTAAEVKLIRKHPEQGASVLNASGELKRVMPLILHHHERIDGKGYPGGLKGDEIPLGARIIHVATAYDSLAADRPYRPAQKRESALREIARCKNTQFDAMVTEIALKVL